MWVGRYTPERKTILSAALFADGSRGDEELIAFCEGNTAQFAATTSERSGQILRYISIRSLYRLGKRYGGVQFYIPNLHHHDHSRYLLSQMLDEDEITPFVDGLSPGSVVLPCIHAEFHKFYGVGLVAWAETSGKSPNETALALGGCIRVVYKYRGILRRYRRPLKIAPFADAFARYWAMIFPEPDSEAVEADFPASATTLAADLLNAELNAPAAPQEHPNHARRPKP